MSRKRNNSALITQALEESARLKLTIAKGQSATIEKIAIVIIKALKSGEKVVLFGNGGSAADAQHIAAELMGKFNLERRPLPAIALTTNTSSLTALANDYGYETVFRRQVEALVDKNDVVIGISTSGSSKNVLEGLRAAREKGAITIGLTGSNRHKLTRIADLIVSVPSDSIPRIQEAHITIGHIICELVEKKLFSSK